MFGDIIQPTHLLLILVVALVVLGPKRLPEVGRSLGRGLRDFRHGMQGVQDEARGMFNDALDGPAAAATSPEASTPPVLAAQTQPAFLQDTAVVGAQAPGFAPAQYVTAQMPSSAAVTKVAPVDLDPAEYAD
jgi:sec-independent protein translocase protein TatA